MGALYGYINGYDGIDQRYDTWASLKIMYVPSFGNLDGKNFLQTVDSFGDTIFRQTHFEGYIVIYIYMYVFIFIYI